MCKVGSPQKRNMHVELERLHLQQCFHKNHLLNVSLKKKKRQHFHHHTAYDYRKESKSRWYTTARFWYTTSKPFFFSSMLQIPVSYRQMSQFTTNQTELLFFRSSVISDAGIQRSGAYSDGQRNRYVLLLADQRLFLSLL